MVIPGIRLEFSCIDKPAKNWHYYWIWCVFWHERFSFINCNRERNFEPLAPIDLYFRLSNSRVSIRFKLIKGKNALDLMGPLSFRMPWSSLFIGLFSSNWSIECLLHEFNLRAELLRTVELEETILIFKIMDNTTNLDYFIGVEG